MPGTTAPNGARGSSPAWRATSAGRRPRAPISRPTGARSPESHLARGHARRLARHLELRDHAVGGEHEPSDRRRVLQRAARHLAGVEHAHLHQIAVFVARGIEPEIALALEYLLQHHRRLLAAVGDDLAQRILERAAHDLNARVLVGVLAVQRIERRARAQQRHAAARQNPLLDRCARRVQRVLGAALVLLHLGLGRGADADHRDTARQLGGALLQLLAVEVPGRELLQRAPRLLGDHRAAADDRDVLQHCLAPVAEARRLHRAGLDHTAQRVDDQRRERLAFDFFGHHEQRLAALGDVLEHRQQVAHRRDLLVVQQQVRVLQHHLLLVAAVDEVRREEAPVELHALDHLELVGQPFAVLDRDHAFFADLLHRLGDHLADCLVVVGRDRRDLRDFGARRAGPGEPLEIDDDRFDGEADAALEVHRVHAGGDVLHALGDDAGGEHDGGSGAVAGHLGGLGRDFAHHLRAHVLEVVLELDFLGHDHAGVDHHRRPVGLFEHYGARFRAERDAHRVAQYVHSPDDPRVRRFAEQELFCRHGRLRGFPLHRLAPRHGRRLTEIKTAPRALRRIGLMDKAWPGARDALLVVDVQKDFLPGGALAVAHGDEVVAPLNAAIQAFERAGRPVYASRDWHPANHCSFKARGGPWPPHCVAGTRGAEFADGLALPPATVVISKADSADTDAYSAFGGNDLAAQLKRKGVRRVVIGGLTTDYCVVNTVLDARAAGFDVLVLAHAIRAVDVRPGDGARALEAMRKAGAWLEAA